MAAPMGRDVVALRKRAKWPTVVVTGVRVNEQKSLDSTGRALGFSPRNGRGVGAFLPADLLPEREPRVSSGLQSGRALLLHGRNRLSPEADHLVRHFDLLGHGTGVRYGARIGVDRIGQGDRVSCGLRIASRDW